MFMFIVDVALDSVTCGRTKFRVINEIFSGNNENVKKAWSEANS